jgi:transcriptional regulator with XRE-family HTH domain
MARREPEEIALDALMRENLKREIKRLKVSRYRLAQLIGADPSTFSKILTSEDRGIGKMMLYKLRNAGISIDALMAGQLPAQSPIEQTPRPREPRSTGAIAVAHHHHGAKARA